MNEHTPWKRGNTASYAAIGDTRSVAIFDSRRPSPERVANAVSTDPVEAFARADEIIKAVNAYGPLVEALTDCRQLIEHMMPYIGQMALPDYALLNEAPMKADKILKDIGEDTP